MKYWFVSFPKGKQGVLRAYEFNLQCIGLKLIKKTFDGGN